MSSARSVDRIVLVGPASPATLATDLDGVGRAAFERVRGLGGNPVTSLAKGLLAAGCQVEVVTLAPEIAEPVVVESGRLRVLVGPYRARGRARAKDFYRQERSAIRSLLRSTDGDLVHAHWTYEFAWACESERRPVLTTAHDAPLTVLRYLHSAYWVARILMAYRVRMGIRHLSVVSPYLADRWRRQMLYRAPITVVPNIAEAPPYESPAGPPGQATGGPVVLDVSEADPNKNVGTLLAAFVEVRRRVPGARLCLVGPGLGPDQAFAARAHARGLGDGVTFVGPVPWERVGGYLREAAVFAHPCVNETFGLSVSEAMCEGLPVVGAASGAVPWTLDGGRAGVLCDPTRPSEFADAIVTLLTDRQRAAQLGEAGRQRAATCFGRDTVTSRYLDWYDQCAG